MPPKVCILTAGAGSRLNDRTKYFNKALLRIGDQAAISHQIEMFPPDTQFVIALGYKGDIVSQYLKIAHPYTNFIFVNIDKYNVYGSGPGYALNKCKSYLQSPFYFLACDTLLEKSYLFHCNIQSGNWVAYDLINKDLCANYCTLHIDEYENVLSFCDKQTNGTGFAFTGFAHIEDYKQFWEAMEQNTTLIHEEIQLSPALFQLGHLKALKISWFDIGTEAKLLEARKQYLNVLQNLDKADEELYIVNQKVIKYFHNASIVRSRLARGKFLEFITPYILSSSKNFYKYNYIYGSDLFNCQNVDDLMGDLLAFAQQKLWTDVKLDSNYQKKMFHEVCYDFYIKKTTSRLEKFYTQTGLVDKEETINGIYTRHVNTYLSFIDWKSLCNGIPSGFHGDFQLSNVIIDLSKSFVLIDWRQDFGGLIEYGDRYYDFAKMYACLLMPHTSIKSNQYSIKHVQGETFVDIFVPQKISQCREVFDHWLKLNGYDKHKTMILACIVMLNMAPLHEPPLNEWLYFYSKKLLASFYTEFPVLT